MALTAVAALAQTKTNIIDEVAWVVGDEAIFRSDVEEHYAQMRSEGDVPQGNPFPEKLAVEKLYLHQAKLDTIEPPAAQVSNAVEKRINFFIANLGSREKLEEYFRKPLPQLREQLTEVMQTQYIIEQVQSQVHTGRRQKVFRQTPGRQHPLRAYAGGGSDHNHKPCDSPTGD